MRWRNTNRIPRFWSIASLQSVTDAILAWLVVDLLIVVWTGWSLRSKSERKVRAKLISTDIVRHIWRIVITQQ
jgi:hypothetical protein